jgi:hypothetical protein
VYPGDAVHRLGGRVADRDQAPIDRPLRHSKLCRGAEGLGVVPGRWAERSDLSRMATDPVDHRDVVKGDVWAGKNPGRWAANAAWESCATTVNRRWWAQAVLRA